jgi:hypothetical protein
LLALLILVGVVTALVYYQGPDAAAVGDLASPRTLRTSAPPSRRQSQGLREGTLGLVVGSRVMCLSDPELGEGTVVEDVGLLAHVIFESTQATLPVAEIQPADTGIEDGRSVDTNARGPLPREAPRGRPIIPGNSVVCPARPGLGTGMLESLKHTFIVSYESGLRTQTDDEVRPAPSSGPEPPASVRGQHTP